MKKNMELVHPILEDRRDCVRALYERLWRLSRARTLPEVAIALLELESMVTEVARLFGIKLDRLKGDSGIMWLYRRAGKNGGILSKLIDGTTEYGSVKAAILRHARIHSQFTVNDLVAMGKDLNVSRQSLSANLYILAMKGEKPLERVADGKRGRSGLPAVYRLRDVLGVTDPADNRV